ncbi:MAG: HhH-GPD family protein [Mycobacterium sp.]|nr:HhH-GPD family protein [Mycobacterium sp.]
MTATADLVPRLRSDLLGWYDAEQRDLPWRRPGTAPWPVLVSEVMLQQTPVRRVLPAFSAWLERWPTPADLAREPAGEAVRAWDRLGYPRRALRLHAAAAAITERHGGRVPDTLAELLALPGIGAYTARALLAFAFRQRVPVVDVNVRRVVARAVEGRALGPAAVSAADLRLVETLLPEEPEEAATVSVALMELGALVCTATRPRCAACPLVDACAWVAAGRPPHDGPPRVAQPYAGTDRQVRGRLLAVLRGADAPVAADALAAVWDDAVQRDRALAGLVADGLAQRTSAGYQLPA